MKKILLSIALLLTGLINAQTPDYKWGLGFNIGIAEYYGEMGNGFFNFDLTPHTLAPNIGSTETRKNQPGFATINLSRYYNSNIDFNFSVASGEWGYYKDATTNFYRGFQYADATARWKFLGKDYARFTPYLLGGLGYRRIQFGDINDISNSQHELVIPLGVGVNVRLAERVYLNLISHYGLTTGDKAEDRAGLDVDFTDQLWHHSVGIQFLLGKAKDTDGDGVSDGKDKCANTTAGDQVDKNGCTVDTDGDGIADNKDKCPTVKGLTAFAGCPDTDGDGVEDSKDKCIDVKGIAKFDGCPDTDGDGIQDSEDKCPTVVGIAQFNGCPDTDGDGIEDAKDECPKLKGIAEFNGCPDTDGDGIADNKDKCPKVAGPASNGGCPEIKAAVKQLFEKALQGIQFETGKSIIKKQSFPILDQVVKVMIENPDYRLFVMGHTDNVGKEASNLQLSKERALAVEQYMEKKGISSNRIESDGYGDTQPVQDNKTAPGRAKNRRVEFKVLFEDFVR